MPPSGLSEANASLQAFIKEKSTKLKLPISSDLPAYVPPHNSTTQTPTFDVLALTYDCMYAVMEEVMLVDARVKEGVDQATSYLRKLAHVWMGARDASAFLDGDALQFWVSSFPPGILAVPWLDMDAKLQLWVHNQRRRLGVLWSSNQRTPAARALRLRLEGCLTGYVSVLSLALFVYKSTLMDSLVNFCADDIWTPPTKDVIVTVGYPKETETSLRQYGFTVFNLGDWIDFKMWLFAQKEIRAMMKCEPNVVEFIVNNDVSAGRCTLGEEITRFLRARRILSPVTIIGVSNSQILHHYDSLYLANDLDNVWALNRYHRYEFKRLAETSAKFLKQAPRHHRNDLVDTFPYKSINLPALPPITCQLDWMRILILEDNSLEHLPASIGHLTSLFRLTLTSNKLQYIPASVGLLTQLKELYINKNNFSTLPIHVCKLVGLKVLSVANNPLTVLPQAMTTLTSLVDLDVHGTPLTVLPHSMGDMTGLQNLTLDKENFQSYTKSFCEGSTQDKIKFLKELQPGSRTGCQQLIMLGKDGANVLKNIGSNARKVTHGVYEVDLKNAQQDVVTFTVWDFTGKDVSVEMSFFTPNAIYIIVENDRNNTTIARFRTAVQSAVNKENIVFIAVYTFSANQEDAEDIASTSGCYRVLFLGNDDYKKEFQDIVPNIARIERPEIAKSYYMFSKFMQEQSKMFMRWSEVQAHIKCYTTDPDALKFLVTYGYIFFQGDSANLQQNENAMLVLPPALNLVPQIKANLKGFERITLQDLLSRLGKLCGDSVNFQLVIALLQKYSVVHSIDDEKFFLVPFIPPYVPNQSFIETSDNPITLVRMYTSQEPVFSLEWFLNVITGIHSTCEGFVQLLSIDSHSALITIDFPDPQQAGASPQLVRATSFQDVAGSRASEGVAVRSVSAEAISGSGSPKSARASASLAERPASPSKGTLRGSTGSTSHKGGTLRGFANSTSFPRLSGYLSLQRFNSDKNAPQQTTSPLSSPKNPSSPKSPTPSPNGTISSFPPLPPQFKCYLHRSASKTDHNFWFVLSCPGLTATTQITFITILRNIQWLLNHWINNPFYTFSTSCYNCFDMHNFVKTKIANCPITQTDCIANLRDFSAIECAKCKHKLDVSILVPDLALPLYMERRVDAKEFTESEKIATGGYGHVYKRTMNGRDVVVKVSIRNEDEHVEKFIREMALSSNMQHKNIISCVGLSRAPTLAILLEFAPLGSLNDVISKPATYDLPRTLLTRIALEIAGGMRFMHDRGIAYGDLKSLNVLVMSLDLSSKEPLVKITDFGTAEYHMGFSAKYQRYCTSTYKSPETFTSTPVDMVLADIYCYGLVLWELMARKTVEAHLQEQDKLRKTNGTAEVQPKDRHVLFSGTTLPSSVVSSPLKSLLNDCLHEFPKRRIQSFRDIEERIKNISES